MKSCDVVRIDNIAKRSGIIIRWHITSLCNYQCDFCIQGDRKRHIEKSKGESPELRKNICNKLIDYIENEINGKYKLINLYLIGGEITILPDFLDIVNKIVNCKFKGKITIRITTNLSTKTEILEQLSNIFKSKPKRKLSVLASYYKEFSNEDEFIEKIKLINKKNKFKNVPFSNKLQNKIDFIRRVRFEYGNLNIRASIGYPLCNDKDYDDYLEFKKRNRIYADSISFIIIKGYKTSISEEIKGKILKNSNGKCIRVKFNNGKVYYFENTNKIALKLDNEDSFNPKGYLCDTGIRSISIDNLGNISRCTSCKKASYIGNILTDGVKLMTDKFICPSNSCGCTYFKSIRKNEK